MMANEYLLKLIVDGLEHLAADNATVCEYLNLRAALYRYRQRFERTALAVPHPPYPDKHVSQTAAADLIGRIADNAALTVLYLGGRPASPAILDADLDEADVLRLVLDWEVLQSGAYKVILQLYGQQPACAPALASPGASSEARLWAEIVAWFAKIVADTDRVINVQRIQTAGRDLTAEHISKKKGSRHQRHGSGILDALDPLRRLEQEVQRATLNTLTFAGLLPRHLYHAARVRQRTPVRR
jgi:hypothetical protein